MNDYLCGNDMFFYTMVIKRVKEMHENDWLCVRPINQKSR